jgi:hypothetical protein
MDIGPFFNLTDEKTKGVFCCGLVGSSMKPILGEQDLLQVRPYIERRIQAGDVIFCLPPGQKTPVVHRVVCVTPRGVRTRGENSNACDPWLLDPGHILGQVVAAWRGRQYRKIAGGWVGRLLARKNRWRRVLVRAVRPVLHPLYRGAGRRGLVSGLLPLHFSPRVAIFKIAGQVKLQLLVGRRVVGRYDGRRCQWNIQFPFRLFVDEAALPDNPSKVWLDRNQSTVVTQKKMSVS